MGGFEEVPTKGAVTKFRQRMGTDFNRFFNTLSANSSVFLVTFAELFARFITDISAITGGIVSSMNSFW